MRNLRASKRNNKGLAAVETTLILPLFFLFFALTAEFGKLYYDYLTLTKLQRSATRYLSANLPEGVNQVPNLTGGDAPLYVAQAKNLILYGSTYAGTQIILEGLTTDDIQVIALEDNHIQINTNYQTTPVFGDLLASLANIFVTGNEGLSLTLKSSSVMRVMKKL